MWRTLLNDASNERDDSTSTACSNRTMSRMRRRSQSPQELRAQPVLAVEDCGAFGDGPGGGGGGSGVRTNRRRTKLRSGNVEAASAA